MRKLFIGFDDIADARNMGALDSFVVALKSHITAGGLVIIEQRFENSEPVMIARLTTIVDLESWLRGYATACD